MALVPRRAPGEPWIPRSFPPGECGSFLYTTRHGKFRVWNRILDEVHGDECPLDMGCGRGAVLTAVAMRAFNILEFRKWPHWTISAAAG